MMSHSSTSGFDSRLSSKDHRRVATFIDQVAGIQLPDTKRSLVESRLAKRQRSLGFKTLGEYIEFALSREEGVPERLHMLDSLTTNKTEFYREPTHFDILKDYLNQQKPLSRYTRKNPFRLWSAGSSTGEEPYTLAMVLSDVAQLHPGFSFHITATDISVSCLKTAKKAIYPHQRVQPVPMESRKKYLLRSKDKHKDLVAIAPEVKEKVSFSMFNLLTDKYSFSEPFEVIFCRNVMIYFDLQDRMAIADHFATVLRPGGLLFIGHSESLAKKEPCYRGYSPTVYQRL